MAKCKQMEIKTAGKSKLRSTEKGWLRKMAGGKWVESRKCIMWNWARKYHTFPHALSFKPSLCVCVCVVCVTKFSTQLYAFFLAVVVYLPVISLHFPSSLIFFLLLQRRQFPASAAVCLLNWNNFPIFSLFGGLGRVFVFFQCVLALAGFTPRSIQGLSRSGPRIFRFRFYFFFFFFWLCVKLQLLHFLFLSAGWFSPGLCFCFCSWFGFGFGFWRCFWSWLGILLWLAFGATPLVSFEAFGTHEKCWQRTALGTPLTSTLASFRFVSLRSALFLFGFNFTVFHF